MERDFITFILFIKCSHDVQEKRNLTLDYISARKYQKVKCSRQSYVLNPTGLGFHLLETRLTAKSI